MDHFVRTDELYIYKPTHCKLSIMPRFTINITTGYNTLRKVGEVQVRVKIKEYFVTEQEKLQQFFQW